MSLIIAARFDTFEAAEEAGRALFREGFLESDVSIFFVNMPGAHATYPLGGDRAADPAAVNARSGAVAGAIGLGVVGVVFGVLAYWLISTSITVLIAATLVGAYIGALLGGLAATRRRRPRREPGRPTGRRHAGILVAVKVQRDTEAKAARVLSEMGGEDVEQATGRWENGKWVDFDPVHSPVLSDKVPVRAG